MNRSEIIKTVNHALAEEFELEENTMRPEARIREDLALDSLDIVDMVIVIEQAFQFKLTEREKLSTIKTLEDIYNFIEYLQEKELAKQ